ncbi:hypothetical protein [Lysobacter gummosus]|uniref:hypothetical protein n=1 Tax=Lysobacter gummosus TaxID=262324 RepID=UPI00363B0695
MNSRTHLSMPAKVEVGSHSRSTSETRISRGTADDCIAAGAWSLCPAAAAACLHGAGDCPSSAFISDSLPSRCRASLADLLDTSCSSLHFLSL